jgi:putative YhdH/YhfP family quinone oxidoreductase
LLQEREAMRVTACRLFQKDGAVTARLVETDVPALSPGDVRIRVEWSGVNYKDALAVTGRGKIARVFPVTAGSDAAGTVLESGDARFSPGDRVLAGGMSLGEARDGGFASHLQVPGDWIVPLPPGLTAFDAMVIGTAGFTAALALSRMEALGQRPGLGPVAVTGAAGGVGSFAILLLARRGYEVIAVTGRPEHAGYLTALGARDIVAPDQLGLGTRPLEHARFGGVVDNVGGNLLSGLIRHVRPWGNVAAIGNAGGTAVDTTVFPFILRGVSLVGGSASNCPMPLRRALWDGLGQELAASDLEPIVDRVVPLQGVLEAAWLVLERRVRGRVVVDCRGAA